MRKVFSKYLKGKQCSNCCIFYKNTTKHFRLKMGGRYYSSHCKTCEKFKCRQYRQKNYFVGILGGIRARCNQPKHISYQYYGARGIKCLIKSHQELQKSLGPKPGPDYSIDRINTNGHYEIGNLRWATCKEQSLNTRTAKRTAEKIKRVGFLKDSLGLSLSKIGVLLDAAPETIRLWYKIWKTNMNSNV